MKWPIKYVKHNSNIISTSQGICYTFCESVIHCRVVHGLSPRTFPIALSIRQFTWSDAWPIESSIDGCLVLAGASEIQISKAKPIKIVFEGCSALSKSSGVDPEDPFDGPKWFHWILKVDVVAALTILLTNRAIGTRRNVRLSLCKRYVWKEYEVCWTTEIRKRRKLSLRWKI